MATTAGCPRYVFAGCNILSHRRLQERHQRNCHNHYPTKTGHVSLSFTDRHRQLGSSPVIWLLLVIQVSNAGNQRRMTLASSPFNSLFLGLERAKDMVCVIFDNKVLNLSTLGAAFWSCFDINVRHVLLLAQS